MGSRKPFWKLSGDQHRRSPSSSIGSPFKAAAALPVEFICPISRSLMADPVLLPPSSQTFERSCIQACADLAFSPPGLSLDLRPSSFSLIPNVSLRFAILNWCRRAGNPPPQPVPPEAAYALVRRLIPPSSDSDAAADRKFSLDEAEDEEQGPTTSNIGVSEEELMIKFLDTEPSEQESAVVLLRRATRENRAHRTALCTPRILAAVRSTFSSGSSDAVQMNAAAALVNLSLEPENRVRIVKSGVVLPLVEVLQRGHPEAQDHAAAALFSLVMEEKNRPVIAALGAIPPLLYFFCDPNISGTVGGRRDAGMALYYLSLADANRSRIAQAPGAVRALLSVASEKDVAPPDHGPGLARLAMMVVCNLAGYDEGRAELVDGGAVASVVSLLESPDTDVEEYCVAALYGMSLRSLRFRWLAKSAATEQVLMRVAEGGGGEMVREMAKKTLKAMRGHADDEYGVVDPPVISEGSVAPEGMRSLRRRSHHYNDSALF